MRKTRWQEIELLSYQLPNVDLAEVMLQDRYTGRPIHQVAQMRKALGIPTTNPGMEKQLKELGLLDPDCKPFPFDIQDAVWMLPYAERATCYGLLLGVDMKDIAKFVKVKPLSVYSYVNSIRQRWMRLADYFGLIRLAGLGELDKPIHTKDLTKVLGYPGSTWVETLTFKAIGMDKYKGVFRKDFPRIWELALRGDELPWCYISSLKMSVTREEYIDLQTRGIVPKSVLPKWAAG